MYKAFNSTMLGLALSSAFSLAHAQTATPITIVSGFNEDIIADGTTATTSTTSGIDSVNVFYDNSYAASNHISGGAFPAGQTVTGADGNSYEFAAASANNGLLLNSSETIGTLSLSYPDGPLGTVYLIGTSASGSTLLDYTLNFAGGASSSGSFSFADWYDSTASGTVTGLGRVSNQTDSYDAAGGNNFSLYSIAISIPVSDQSLTLDNIIISYDGVNAGSSAVIVGVSGAAPASVPEPGTLAFAALGLGLAAIFRRR